MTTYLGVHYGTLQTDFQNLYMFTYCVFCGISQYVVALRVYLEGKVVNQNMSFELISAGLRKTGKNSEHSTLLENLVKT